MSGSATVGSQNGFGIPVFLLKTRSTPNDGYDDYFSAAAGSNKKWQFTPTFVPVMEHRFNEEHLSHFKDLLSNGQISRDADAKYGGLIFTSQRAVEAFARLLTVEDGTPAANRPLQCIVANMT
jgi:uroporphyrinogen-III synthase